MGRMSDNLAQSAAAQKAVQSKVENASVQSAGTAIRTTTKALSESAANQITFSKGSKSKV